MKVAEDAGEPLSARDAPAIVEEQQGQVNRSIQVNAAMMRGAMGVVWLAGFGITYLAFGHGRPGRWCRYGPR